MPTPEESRCQRIIDGSPCRETGHVVLFAPPDAPAQYEFAGQMIRRAQKLIFCLSCGGHIYDAIHGRRTAPWLSAYPRTALPVTNLGHSTTTPSTSRPWAHHRRRR
jgi:hypothetical protein